jgi:hypothetical protein
MAQTKDSPWEATSVPNLIRYRPSGTYFGRFRVGGKLIRQTLDTTVFSVARQRLPEKIRQYQSRLESTRAVVTGKMTVGDASQHFLAKINASASLKPRSKAYYTTVLQFIERSWPTLSASDARRVSERDCEEWLAKFRKQYAPSVVNNSIAVLRAIFQETVRVGARFSNPTADLSRMRLRAKRLQLPSREEFLRFVEEIRTAGARQSKDCANLVQFLAYSGMRIGEAKYVTWADVDFSKRQMHVRGDPETATKNGEMLSELRSKRRNEPLGTPVMSVFDVRTA